MKIKITLMTNNIYLKEYVLIMAVSKYFEMENGEVKI